MAYPHPAPAGYRSIAALVDGGRRRRLTNSFLLKDRCSLSDQISFILASSRRAFILAMRDRDRANKNEIEIFVFGVTSNDFPHHMLLSLFHRISAQNYGADDERARRLAISCDRVDFS